MRIETMTREQIVEDFMKDPIPYLQASKETRKDLDVLLNLKSPEIDQRLSLIHI